ncbi:uncharacterized protein LOC131933317 [Physella acuta]|uniref:uncharacterized protein LOC131933317 n=1 Tax=Physella acuta TaxID=109671 RepID=UPI0027DB268E|nr:uncharacterized protein LOC131933317 [Physella acuta]
MAKLPPTQTLAPAPPPDLQLQLIVDADDDINDRNGAGQRRPSTASLSRFRSCPQLASVMNASQDSPGSDMAPMTDHDGNIIHTAPTVRNSLYVDLPRLESGSLRSAAGTPTPPSTPGSKRRDPMTSSYNSRSNGASPSSTPKLSRRFETRTSSDDSQGMTFECGAAALPLKEENLLRLEELCGRESLRFPHFDDTPDHAGDDVSDTDDGSSMHVSGRLAHRHPHPHHRQHHQHQMNHQHQPNHYPQPPGDDSVDKCSRWLQSLKLNKSDKIKSRSHIQLPPI